MQLNDPLLRSGAYPPAFAQDSSTTMKQKTVTLSSQARWPARGSARSPARDLARDLVNALVKPRAILWARQAMRWQIVTD